MKKVIFALVVSLYLVGCAQPTRYKHTPSPTPEGFSSMTAHQFAFKAESPKDNESSIPDKNADYGSYPSNFKSIIKSDFDDHLIDPDSVKYSKWTDPKKAYLMFGSSSTPKYGYGVEVLVNAKNSFGGYTGNKHYWVLIKDGLITEIYEKYIIEGIAFKMGYVD